MPSEVAGPLRNKLYSAIRRIISNAEDEKVHVPMAVVARYHEATKNSKGVRGPNALWHMLREFVQDPTCLTVTFEERHVRESSKYSKTEWIWITRVETIVMFHGHTWAEGKEHAETLLKAAKATKPHPMCPKDH